MMIADRHRFRDALRRGLSLDAAFGYAAAEEAAHAGQGDPLDQRLVKECIRDEATVGGSAHDVLKRAVDRRISFQGSRDGVGEAAATAINGVGELAEGASNSVEGARAMRHPQGRDAAFPAPHECSPATCYPGCGHNCLQGRGVLEGLMKRRGAGATGDAFNEADHPRKGGKFASKAVAAAHKDLTSSGYAHKSSAPAVVRSTGQVYGEKHTYEHSKNGKIHIDVRQDAPEHPTFQREQFSEKGPVQHIRELRPHLKKMAGTGDELFSAQPGGKIARMQLGDRGATEHEGTGDRRATLDEVINKIKGRRLGNLKKPLSRDAQARDPEGKFSASTAAHAASKNALNSSNPDTHEAAKKLHYKAAELHHSSNWAAAENHENAAMSHNKARAALVSKKPKEAVYHATNALQESGHALRYAGQDGAAFEHVERSVAAKGAHDPKALAAWIGRRAEGKKTFQRKAAAGRRRAHDDLPTVMNPPPSTSGGKTVETPHNAPGGSGIPDAGDLATTLAPTPDRARTRR